MPDNAQPPFAADAAPGSDILLLLLLLALIAVGLIALAALRRPEEKTGRQAARGSLADPQRQLEAVTAVRFEPIALMSQEERQLFNLIEAALAELAPGHRLLTRVGLDEVVRPLADTGRDQDRAMASIRSKRLDFAIFDGGGRIVAALGCEARARQIGEGRDRVRRAAMAQARVPYVLLTPGIRVDDLCLALDGLVGPRLRPVAAAFDAAWGGSCR